MLATYFLVSFSNIEVFTEPEHHGQPKSGMAVIV